jgi:outer membrane protein OmpA-like peptidoglycan-associated protein
VLTRFFKTWRVPPQKLEEAMGMYHSRRSVVWVVFAMVASFAAAGAPPAAAQFGAIRDAARRAAEDVKKKATEATKTSDGATNKEPPAAVPASAAAQTETPAFATFSKFDFVPGEKVVAAEDFSQDAVGDFPAKWNTDAAGEVVTVAGSPGRWLKLTRAGFFLPEFLTELPDNFTLEFDLLVPPDFNAGFPLNTSVVQLADPRKPAGWQSSPNIFTFTAHPAASTGGTSSVVARQDGTSAPSNQTQAPQLLATRGTPVHMSVWRQRQRVRVYMNAEKVWDVPRAAAASAKFNALVFFVPGGCGNCEYYLANLRVATGAPDTRNKVLTEGKWVSHGILFDVNSDRIKGESYGSLKEIATVLAENADVRMQIVGHTDSDGNDAANLDLSKRRAASVKAALVTEFKIDGGRLDTDGKGESQPLEKNDTPAGKANNRRVEFVRK